LSGSRQEAGMRIEAEITRHERELNGDLSALSAAWLVAGGLSLLVLVTAVIGVGHSRMPADQVLAQFEAAMPE
jgi:hypothetical protein